jgi:sigma-B regulation protein RsbU (phosphoserine phosphatase)
VSDSQRAAPPGAAPGEPRPLDFRSLMRRVEQVVRGLEQIDDSTVIVRRVAEEIIRKFRDALGITGGRLYRRQGGAYVLEATLGAAKQVPAGLEVPVEYLPVALVLEGGVAYMASDDPRIDPAIERELGSHEFAAIEVGDHEHIVAFDVTPGHHRDDILFSLGILRHAINDKLRRDRIEGIFREARRIQSSILPQRMPRFGPFDIAGRVDAVETVAGDYFGFIPLTDKILGIGIADVSGHGLPAALQVRDVHMGLRMGLARDFKIVRTVERLNRIIHESTLTSRFVSMFYGELELNGVFIYVNAGHPAPFHLARDGGIRFLDEGGPVLGPLPQATYERGFVRMQPGDMLVLFTDGIVEAGGTEEGNAPEFGVERLLETCRAHQGRSAREVTDAIFAAVNEFAGGEGMANDDRTVVVVTYPAG